MHFVVGIFPSLLSTFLSMFVNSVPKALAICFALSSTALAQITACSSPTATVDSGILIGTTTSLPAATASINKFLGVPFAQPPVRFAPPKKLANNASAPIVATAWGYAYP